jgi:hypothetical protein
LDDDSESDAKANMGADEDKIVTEWVHAK